MVDGDGMIVDVSCDVVVLIGTVEAPGGGKIKLLNHSHHVERAHGLNLLTFAPSPYRSMQTSGQARFGSETLRYST